MISLNLHSLKTLLESVVICYFYPKIYSIIRHFLIFAGLIQFYTMVLMLSDEWSWFIAVVIVAGVVGAMLGSAGFDDMMDHPWKYRKVFEANEAKKKAKEQAKKQNTH